MTPQQITYSDVDRWIGGLTLKPSSVRRYLATLRLVLDYAGAEPNPARDDRIRLPRIEHVELEPPSGADVDAIIGETPDGYKVLVRVLAETGMRVGEYALNGKTSTSPASASASATERRPRPADGFRCRMR